MRIEPTAREQHVVERIVDIVFEPWVTSTEELARGAGICSNRQRSPLARAGFDNLPEAGYLFRMRNNPSGASRHRLIYLLSVAQRRLQRWMASQPQNDVTPAQAGLLFVLGKQDGVLMGEAGAALDMGPAGISGLVDRSAAAKLVERRADREDGRAWRVWMTPKGRTVLAQVKSATADINAALTEGFTTAEIDIVARWLTSIQDKFPRDATKDVTRDPEE